MWRHRRLDWALSLHQTSEPWTSLPLYTLPFNFSFYMLTSYSIQIHTSFLNYTGGKTFTIVKALQTFFFIFYHLQATMAGIVSNRYISLPISVLSVIAIQSMPDVRRAAYSYFAKVQCRFQNQSQLSVFLLQSAAATNVCLSLSTSTTDGWNYALPK